MTRFDLHPEELLDRAARGTASLADRARLEQHLLHCDVCRVERALMTQAALDAAPLRDEQLLVGRLKRDVSARLASPTARRSKRRSVTLVAALAVGGLASVAAAATIVILRPQAPAPSVTAAPLRPSAGAAKAREPQEAAAPERELDLPSNQPLTESSKGPASKPAAVDLSVEPPSASALFSRANQARREGKVAEAVRLYRTLQERHSGTSEELVSRVSLGRLLLDTLGDSPGALVQFNSYLASPGGGALRESAMVGRAIALGRMGRSAEERAAWKALLEAWPKSTHQKRARARLAELDGGGGDFAFGAPSAAGARRGTE
jgi:hypothetical protein